jgi:molybdopterin-containing oxidoreductase family iron-sulfur binding subunit
MTDPVYGPPLKERVMELNRREVLKSAAIGGAALVGGGAMLGVPGVPCARCQDPALAGKPQAQPAPIAGRPPSDPLVRQGIAGRKWVMVMDLATCDGCGTCTRACSKMHFIPPDREWIPVMKMQDAPGTAPYFFPKPCFHCDNPPCTKVCPVDATFKRQDGIVLIDNERCIGCRFCMAACPYSTRHFNWHAPQEPAEAKSCCYSPEQGHPRRIGTVEKCDFCPDMAERGLLPGCAQSCPFGVIYYGDQNEDAVTNGLGVTVRLTKLLEERAAYRYMEELGTEPRVYYLPPKNRKFPGPKLRGKDGAGAETGGKPMPGHAGHEQMGGK